MPSWCWPNSTPTASRTKCAWSTTRRVSSRRWRSSSRTSCFPISACRGFPASTRWNCCASATRTLPFIFVSATLGEEAAIEALRNGATDYILKQNPAGLASAVRRALAEAEARRTSRRAEKELIRAQRFESLAMLAGGLSHDLRNLLQPLLLAGDSLQDYQDDPRLARLGKLVRDCGKRGLDMVHSMLSFAGGARRAEQVRLGALFSAFDLLMQGSVPRTVTMEMVIDDPELSFEGNHTELQQCLLNLCLNAIQAMPDGGQLRIETSQAQLPEDFFLRRKKPRRAATCSISVIDTGAGHGQGGAGAAVRAVLHHQGSRYRTGSAVMQAHRQQPRRGDAGGQPGGRGTRFDLYMPLEELVEDSAQSDDLDDLEGSAERVLVVVEEAGQLSLLTDTLDAYGYQAHRQPERHRRTAMDRGGRPARPGRAGCRHEPDDRRAHAGGVDRAGLQRWVILLARPDDPPDLHELPPLEHLYVVEKPLATPNLLRMLRKAIEATSADDFGRA